MPTFFNKLIRARYVTELCGRPAKYGAKFTRENIDALPAMEDELLLYGKSEDVYLQKYDGLPSLLVSEAPTTSTEFRSHDLT